MRTTLEEAAKPVILAKKIGTILLILVMGLVGFGYLPKRISERITKALIIVFLVGFTLRVGAYLLQG